jgi:hypothetical protein
MIKNYTSSVSSEKSVSQIEITLVRHGAKNIFKTYEDKSLNGIAFTMPINGKDIPFKIPARTANIEKRMLSSIKKPRKGTIDKIKQQSARTAWKILLEWVQIQMTLIDMDQADFMEVFMPYIYDSKSQQTFFDRFKNDGFKLLEHK